MSTIDPQSQVFILNAIESLRNEMVARFESSNDKVDGINKRLDTLNGKTAKNSKQVARLNVAVFYVAGPCALALVTILFKHFLH